MAKRQSEPAIVRPTPPEPAEDMFYAILMPAPEIGAWVQSTILAEDGPLHNPDHAHLIDADVEFLWVSSAFNKQGRTVVG